MASLFLPWVRLFQLNSYSKHGGLFSGLSQRFPPLGPLHFAVPSSYSSISLASTHLLDICSNVTSSGRPFVTSLSKISHPVTVTTTLSFIFSIASVTFRRDLFFFNLVLSFVSLLSVEYKFHETKCFYLVAYRYHMAYIRPSVTIR